MQDIIFFDLETTGVSITKDRIVQLSAIKVNQDMQIIDKKKILVNPTIPIPKEASDVHHITDEMVKDCPRFKSYSKAVFEFFKDCILAGFNIKNFDVPLLAEEFAREGLDFNFDIKIIDAYQIFIQKEKRDLASAVKFYCGYDIEGAHDAEVDNKATIDVLSGQMFAYGMSLNECIEFCKTETLDFAGKIGLKDGEPIYTFGKDKGKKVRDEPGFARWMLSQDFSSNTKSIIRDILKTL